MLHSALLSLHLLAAVLWLGGMFMMLYCVAPAAQATLVPPQPLQVLEATLSRFLKWVGIAVIVLLITGIHLYGLRGGLAAHWGVHAMAVGGVAMMLIYGHIRFGPFKRLSVAVNEKNWENAKAAIHQVRSLVQINFLLGIAIVIAVKIGA